MVTVTKDSFFLTEIIRRKVVSGRLRIGRLDDMIIAETGKLPEVTHLIVSRAFGHRSLLVPWDKVSAIEDKQICVHLEGIEQYEKEPDKSNILLRDYILDKKVLDLDDNEVEVVYDVKMAVRNDKLYASEVDFSRYGLLRRMRLKWLANFFTNRFKEESLSWAYIQPLPEHIGSFSGQVKLKVLKEKLADINPVDLADILEELDHAQRVAVFSQLETERAADTLEEAEPRVQRDLISSIKKERAAELINNMTPAQAADILAILPAADADDILKLIDREYARKVEFLIDKQEENILNFITRRFIEVPPETKVQQILDQYREVAKDKDVIMYIYVVSPNEELLGVVDLKELLQANYEDTVKDIMTSSVVSLNPQDTLLETAEAFSRYSFRAIPVTDSENKILGVIPYRDIMHLKHRFV
ncbi:MAG TPA: CBS domain-containing protein [Acidiferrobacterales bacterium]|nr:CBS domain-containing protein [Acidiferrobacterales bacterium]